MKVLWISQNLPYPPKTGVLQRNYNLIREAARFADVHLVAIAKVDILPEFDESVATRELQKLCTRVDVVHLAVEQSKVRFMAVVLRSLFDRNPFTANWAVSADLRGTLERAVASHAPDVVFFDTISLAGYRDVAADRPRILNHHNIESQLLDRRVQFETHPLKRFYLQLEAPKLHRYEAEVAGDFDVNVVVSSLDGARLAEICPGVSTAVIANGVDTDYFRDGGAEPEPEHLIMVSGMNWFPNRDAVLYMCESIWPALTASMPRAKLTVVGASPPPAVVQLARSDPRVTVTGFVDDVRPYIERAGVYLCPMRDGGGTRVKILDAMSMGKAIVATTMAMEGIAAEPERDVLIADTPDAFVRQIGRAVEDHALRRRLGQAAREFALRHFSWRVIGRGMQDLFESLAGARCERV